MTAYSSLISTIPMPQQQWQTPTDTPPVASVKVSDVDTTESVSKNDTINENQNFISRYFQNLKNKMIEKRIKKLENIPPEQRTPSQQAEIEANAKEKALNVKA